MCVAHRIFAFFPHCYFFVPHLHILRINLNTNYDSVASASAALRAMHTIFPEPEGIGITAR
jgi:hypothetical protein